ncbi:MAG: serine hydrolase [Microthrixaceae bacterium]|nr:serine hydrolase [Microthrixaceae bacterium]
MSATVSELPPLPRQAPGVPWPNDAWPVGEIQAVDPAGVDRLIDRAFTDQPSDDLALTLAVVVIQGGRLVLERYGPDTDHNTPLVSWSMAKSITQAALGLLVLDGAIDPDALAPVPEWADPGDPRSAITTQHLLAMRSGLHWVEDYVDPDASTCLPMLFGDERADMAHYAASLPLDHEPGSTFLYSSGTTNILSRIVGDAVGGGRVAMERHLSERLFGPLGITSADPRFDDAGTFVGSSYVWATARDFARFGQLYLRDGVWDGRRLLPEGWVDRARRLRSIDEDGVGYGEQWWVDPNSSLGTFWANGYEGQSITVVPGADTVIVRLGKTPIEQAPALAAWRHDLLVALAGSS